jgi:type IV secretion system protein TrbG
MKTIPIFLLALTLSAYADPPPPPSPTPQESPPTNSKFDPALLGGTNPVLTNEERAGVEITQAWRDKSYASMAGRAGSNSSPEFRFGESLPTIVCAILQVTDIELQPGESITHINLGDSTRWSVESAQSGSRSALIEHLLVKPRDIGLSTSLVVTTDRRTYHLLLVSDEKDFMHYVTFLYPDSSPEPTPAVSAAPPPPTPPPAAAAKIASKSARRHHADGKEVRIASKNQPADDADESYTVQGRADWVPVEVYSKDGKTYLEMPSSVRHKEAPVLFEEKKAGWFHHSKNLVNYRVHGRWYVVDRVLDNATLVSGVGAGQEKVDIRHLPAKKEEGSPNGK